MHCPEAVYIIISCNWLPFYRPSSFASQAFVCFANRYFFHYNTSYFPASMLLCIKIKNEKIMNLFWRKYICKTKFKTYGIYSCILEFSIAFNYLTLTLFCATYSFSAQTFVCFLRKIFYHYFTHCSPWFYTASIS